MVWLKQKWAIVGLGILILGVLLFTKGSIFSFETINEATKRGRMEKVLASKIEKLSNEEICANIGYLLMGYCGSGGCFLDQPLEEWIDKAQDALHSRGVTAYEYKDSDIDCSELVVERIDEIYETMGNN